jgi:hypothetical protein
MNKRREYLRYYYLKNKERIDQRQAEYRTKNKEKIRIKAKESYEKKKQVIPDLYKQTRRAWYLKNREVVLEKCKLYYHNNKLKKNESKRVIPNRERP